MLPRHKTINPGKEMHTINAVMVVTFWPGEKCVWRALGGTLVFAL